MYNLKKIEACLVFGYKNYTMTAMGYCRVISVVFFLVSLPGKLISFIYLHLRSLCSSAEELTNEQLEQMLPSANEGRLSSLLSFHHSCCS